MGRLVFLPYRSFCTGSLGFCFMHAYLFVGEACVIFFAFIIPVIKRSQVRIIFIVGFG